MSRLFRPGSRRTPCNCWASPYPSAKPPSKLAHPAQTPNRPWTPLARFSQSNSSVPRPSTTTYSTYPTFTKDSKFSPTAYKRFTQVKSKGTWIKERIRREQRLLVLGIVLLLGSKAPGLFTWGRVTLGVGLTLSVFVSLGVFKQRELALHLGSPYLM